MTDLQKLQEFATDREWRQQLNKKECELIQSVVSVQSRQKKSSHRYDPMFSYGSEENEIWRVTLADGSRKILNIECGGNTDGLWFIMEVK